MYAAARPGSLNGLNTSQFNKPAVFDSDQLKNNEIAQDEWLDHTRREPVWLHHEVD